MAGCGVPPSERIHYVVFYWGNKRVFTRASTRAVHPEARAVRRRRSGAVAATSRLGTTASRRRRMRTSRQGSHGLSPKVGSADDDRPDDAPPAAAEAVPA